MQVLLSRDTVIPIMTRTLSTKETAEMSLVSGMVFKAFPGFCTTLASSSKFSTPARQVLAQERLFVRVQL